MICKWNRLGQGFWALPLLLLGCGPNLSARGQEEGPSPAGSVLYTAAGAVRALQVGRDGHLWAATSGGVICWTSGEAAPRRWTTADGLGSNDVHSVTVDGDGISVTTALGQDWIDAMGVVSHRPLAARALRRRIDGGSQVWAVTPVGLVRQGDGRRLSWPEGEVEAEAGNVTGVAADGPTITLATSFGLWHWVGGHWHPLLLPFGSPASHVSALRTVKPGNVFAGLYGDGVYRLTDRGQWQRLTGQPAACRFATALAQTSDGGLAVGTRAGSVWREQDGRWQAYALPPSLPSADVGCLTLFHGALWAGSFDGGLLRLSGTDGETAQVFTRADGLRSDSPRGLAVFRGSLYVRGADGQFDASEDGRSWHPAFTKADIPRPEVYALAVQDDHRLLVGGWAGWAATDGHTWERHYHDAELQGQVVTAIAAQGDTVWIGTQKRGLLRYQGGRYTAFQEAQGMTDDWITCLGVHGTRLLVGTYTGGLLEHVGERFVVRLQANAFAIRAVAFDPDNGAALAATPLGLYREDTPDHWKLIDARLSGGLETQAVLPCAAGIWVAGRAGLAFAPRRDL